MYSKKEIKALHEEFWTALGVYLSPVPSAEGEKINWINYKTGVNGIRFLMSFTSTKAEVAIEFRDTPLDNAAGLYEKFQRIRPQFHSFMKAGEEWIYHPADSVNAEGLIRLTAIVDNINVRDKANWPAAISFFKQNIIGLDAFWSQFKFLFEE